MSVDIRRMILSQINHIESDARIVLFHGARRRITGKIVHDHSLARDDCDFGKSFYMGDVEIQAKTLVGNEKEPYFYKIELDLSGLHVVKFNSLAWALVVALNSGKLDDAKLRNFIMEQYAGCDLMVGPIADDKMFVMLNRFFENAMTDKGLVKAIACLHLGTQYALKSEKADNNISILREEPINKNNQQFREDMKIMFAKRQEAIRLAEEIRIDSFGQGMLMAQIIKNFHGKRHAVRPR